jgi:hypothetical protein
MATVWLPIFEKDPPASHKIVSTSEALQALWRCMPVLPILVTHKLLVGLDSLPTTLAFLSKVIHRNKICYSLLVSEAD